MPFTAPKMKFPVLPGIKSFATRKEWEIAAWRAFVDWCARRDPKTLRRWLGSLTTPHERRLIARRAAAVARIKSGTSYRAIGRELWLTRQTVSAIKKALTTEEYASNWERARTQKRARDLARLKKYTERLPPKRYRRTKYGKVRVS